jgi:membrane protease YdiL (CAAX protease family)
MQKDQRIDRSSRQWTFFAGIVAVLGLIFAAIARTYVVRYALPLRSALGIYLCFVAQLSVAVLPAVGFRPSATGLWLWNPRKFVVLPSLWCFPFIIYASGTGDWNWSALLKLLGLALAMLAIYRLAPVREAAGFTMQDALVSIILIGAVLSHLLRGIWSVPVNLDFLTRLYLVSIGAWSWTVLRPVPELGYDFRPSLRVLRAAAVNFGYFAVICMPAGLLLRFTAWNPKWRGVGAFLTDFLEIFLFVALLEELFFRGFLQTLISRSLGSRLGGKAVVSCLFGLFHILHAPFPNWRYVLLASVAGWFYGSAFESGGTLLASTLTHATVDTVWRTFLTR